MNPVLVSLSFMSLMASYFLSFVGFSPNRFVEGLSHSMLGISLYFLLLLSGTLLSLLIGFTWRRWKGNTASIIIATLTTFLLIGNFIGVGESSMYFMSSASTASTAARVSIGSAFWINILCLSLVMLDCWQKLTAHRIILVGLTALIIGALVFGFQHDWFAQLSIIKEYENNRSRFDTALLQHIQLIFMALIPTLFGGLFIGWLTWRYQFLNKSVFSLLNLLQTIPSIALFALLMIPLSWLAINYPDFKALGLSGIGVAPAVIALILYTILPVTRNTYIGLHSVSEDIKDAAKGVGMTHRQILWQVILPLALPVILSGVRIAIVQSIGLAVVAALIGAGGLGVFVWEGLGQYALDLVLLGAIPTIIIALIADLMMQGMIWLSYPISRQQLRLRLGKWVDKRTVLIEKTMERGIND